MNELPGYRIFIGDLGDCLNSDKPNHLCVLEMHPPLCRGAQIPFLAADGDRVLASTEQLDRIADYIDSHPDILVHCAAGIERSPLAVTWYLYRKRGLSLNTAWLFVSKWRPQAQDRRAWLEA